MSGSNFENDLILKQELQPTEITFKFDTKDEKYLDQQIERMERFISDGYRAIIRNGLNPNSGAISFFYRKYDLLPFDKDKDDLQGLLDRSEIELKRMKKAKEGEIYG